MTITTTSHSEHIVAEQIRVRGTVQGVGFRPTVWQLAKQTQLVGQVCNDSDGVLIKVWGQAYRIQTFVDRLQTECPPLAKIDHIERHRLVDNTMPMDFTIDASQSSDANTAVAPDAATCPACLAETLDVSHPRYGYPFTNCTHCGPRFSIIKSIPYDRDKTSMARFRMCPTCQQEYDTPSDRRFHAQPNACPQCGPQVWFEPLSALAHSAKNSTDTDPLLATIQLLCDGGIVAIKGIGGFHLACDATNVQAVKRLRQRKQRYHKPFALMARDIDVIKQYCVISDQEQTLLQSSAAPIVILATKPHQLAKEVAPGQNTLGVMLPYTPLHHLLLASFDTPLVFTSGNVSDEPQCIDNPTAKQKLAPIADAILNHDRDIVNRIDDSVVRMMANSPRVLRRARGYAPTTLPLPAGFDQAPAILALGAELKSTFCLIKQGTAILSQHMGDLENAATYLDYQKNIELYARLYEHTPEYIAIDHHPEYLSSKLGQQRAQQHHVQLEKVSHHHAHIAACLADNAYPLTDKSVLGVALDGLGLGDDDTLWGGEFLLADYTQATRLACFKPVPLLGGKQAMYEPWRNTYAHLNTTLGWAAVEKTFSTLALVQYLKNKPLATLDAMQQKGMNAPLSSSCGRLFDAVAAALDICRDTAHYEGQAAIELENITNLTHLQPEYQSYAYPFTIDDNKGTLPQLNCAPMWQALLTDLSKQTDKSIIAARFQLGLAIAISNMITLLVQNHTQHAIDTIVLSGGVFQNKILFEQVIAQLQRTPLRVLSHQRVPMNDGGIALGQAVITAARTLTTQRSEPCV